MPNPKIRFYQLPDNPLARLGLVLAGIVILALSFMLGIVFLAVAAGLAILGSIALAIRRLFARRGAPREEDEDLLEVEYRVVRRERDSEE